jgi:hypothetical protein
LPKKPLHLPEQQSAPVKQKLPGPPQQEPLLPQRLLQQSPSLLH